MNARDIMNEDIRFMLEKHLTIEDYGHCMNLAYVYKSQFMSHPAAIRWHHAEVGGYMRHVYEVMTIVLKLSAEYGCDAAQMVKLAFIHDVDKLERYELDDEPPTGPQAKYARSLGVEITGKDSKASITVKIDNAKNGTNKPIQYYRYKDIPVADEAARVVRICAENGMILTDDEVHCISCHHGGWSDAGQRGSLSAEATLLHCADLISARVYGLKGMDQD